jgi:Glycosyl hydrolases family 39
MKFRVVPFTVVSPSSFAPTSKCPVGILKVLIFGVLATWALISVDTCGAAASINPSNLVWAVVPLGNTSGPKSATLTNNGASSITINSIVVGGINPKDFVISARTCGTTLAPLASCSLTIRFKPTTTGVRKATLTISDTASNTLQSITLSGTGIPLTSNIAVSPSSLSWPSLSLGNQGASKSIAVTNGGPNSANFSSIKVGGSNSGDFIITTNTCGSSLAATASCSIAIRFKPLSTGNRVGTLTLVDTAANSPQAVSLSGTATPSTSGIFTVSPSTLTFGNVYAGSDGKLLSVTLSNGTSNPVVLAGMSIIGPQANEFAVSGWSCGSSLPSFATCTVTILFKTANTGARSATLTFSTSASNSPQIVALAGTGIASTGTLIANPLSLSWGPVVVGNVSGSKSITLTNNSSATIPLSTIAITSTDSGDFHVLNQTCGTGLAAGASCNVSLSFRPKAVGTRVALLTVAGGAVNSPYAIMMSGTGGPSVVQAPDITVDFDSRSGSHFAIPNGILGAQYIAGDPYWKILSNTANQTAMAQAGFRSTRMHANVPEVYATSTPDWSKIDGAITLLQALGVHPIIEIDLTPGWLQPAISSCPSHPEMSVPVDLTQWGKMAASYVAHFDQMFPGTVLDYEIWNEPDGPNLCSTNKLADYLAIYAAAAPLMKAQATVDGSSIRVGGPATAGVGFQQLLTDPRTAPYVDFYSYHLYLAGPTEIQKGMTWNGEGNTPSLLSMIMNPVSGEQARYLQASVAVKAAKTPLGPNTPIYLDEFNDDWSFNANCCRNNPTYSPLLNSLMVAQLLNSVYAGSAQVPARMIYYAATSNPNAFCLIGAPNAAMDCSFGDSATIVSPYPQMYAYQLLAAPDYLDMANGGYMAKSVVLSTAAVSQGLVATAFYTSTSESILIVNPTAMSFAGVTVQTNNAGIDSPRSTLFALNSANTRISKWPALTTSVINGSQITFDIPPYTVMGISLKEE